MNKQLLFGCVAALTASVASANDTVALQGAIDRAWKAGGGKVVGCKGLNAETQPATTKFSTRSI